MEFLRQRRTPIFNLVQIPNLLNAALPPETTSVVHGHRTIVLISSQRKLPSLISTLLIPPLTTKPPHSCLSGSPFPIHPRHLMFLWLNTSSSTLTTLSQPSNQVLLQFLQPHSSLQPSDKQGLSNLSHSCDSCRRTYSSLNLRCYHFLHQMPAMGWQLDFTCVPPVKEKRYKYLY